MPRFKHNEALRRAIKRMPCFLCGNPESDPCHVATFGARGLDTWWSMVPMCRPHHEEQHRLGGWKKFCDKYPKAAALLKGLGWEFVEAHGKVWMKNEKEEQC